MLKSSNFQDIKIYENSQRQKSLGVFYEILQIYPEVALTNKQFKNFVQKVEEKILRSVGTDARRIFIWKVISDFTRIVRKKFKRT